MSSAVKNEQIWQEIWQMGFTFLTIVALMAVGHLLFHDIFAILIGMISGLLLRLPYFLADPRVWSVSSGDLPTKAGLRNKIQHMNDRVAILDKRLRETEDAL